MQTQERWSPTAVFGEGCKPSIVIQSRVLPFSSTHIPSFPILGVRDNPSVIAARHHIARVTHSRRPNLVFPSSCAVTTCLLEHRVTTVLFKVAIVSERTDLVFCLARSTIATWNMFLFLNAKMNLEKGKSQQILPVQQVSK